MLAMEAPINSSKKKMDMPKKLASMYRPIKMLSEDRIRSTKGKSKIIRLFILVQTNNRFVRKYALMMTIRIISD